MMVHFRLKLELRYTFLGEKGILKIRKMFIEIKKLIYKVRN